MSLSVDVSARSGAFTLDVSFTGSGGLTALFGPSGAGKSSIVELVGGLRQPQRGRITLGDTVLLDTERGICLPPHRRRIGWVFQEGRLFPHLTGRQNLLYGRWFTPRAERREDLARVVDLLGLHHLLDRRPHHYSGGERSRVAIGRALMSSPRLMLMDEPLAALDDARKAEILPYLERLRDETEIEIVYITHAIPEVVRLATRLVLIDAGRVVAEGPTMEVLARHDIGPALGEGEAGAVIEARVGGHDRPNGLTELTARAGRLWVPTIDLGEGTRVRLRIRARDVMIATRTPEAISALNILDATILAIAPADPSSVSVALDCGGDRLLASVTRRSAAELRLAPGQAVKAIVKSVAFDPRGLGGPGDPRRSVRK